MAWREKTAWITLVLMVIAYGTYFTLISGASLSTMSMLKLFGAVTVLQVIAAVIATAVLAALSSDEARAKADERDRAVARRGASIAYFVLIVGVITVGVIMPFRDSGQRLINAALFALVAAETVRYVTVVVSYRRGWHG
jgi:cytochrome bd-type quinol oxidase subunit 2